jgi:hypothetical protein
MWSRHAHTFAPRKEEQSSVCRGVTRRLRELSGLAIAAPVFMAAKKSTTTKRTAKRVGKRAGTAPKPRARRERQDDILAEEKRAESQRRARAPKASHARARAAKRAGKPVTPKRTTKRRAKTGVVLAADFASYGETATPKKRAATKAKSLGSSRTGRSERGGGHGARKAKRHRQRAHGEHHHHA